MKMPIFERTETCCVHKEIHYESAMYKGQISRLLMFENLDTIFSCRYLVGAWLPLSGPGAFPRHISQARLHRRPHARYWRRLRDERFLVSYAIGLRRAPAQSHTQASWRRADVSDTSLYAASKVGQHCRCVVRHRPRNHHQRFRALAERLRSFGSLSSRR